MINIDDPYLLLLIEIVIGIESNSFLSVPLLYYEFLFYP